MDSNFELPVCYRGENHYFKATILRLGYSYKVEVKTSEDVLLFEFDEERNWRAVIHPFVSGQSNKTDRELCRAIANALDTICR